MSLAKAPEEKAPSREEVYQAFLRSLRRRKGFGIVFVQCTPAAVPQLIERTEKELPEKKIALLQLTEPIDNLYDLIANRPDQKQLNILFIQGLEKSLEADIKPGTDPGYGGDGGYYTLDTVPRILSHLNQQRENFRDHFSNLCFVFILPPFAIKYLIRRAPDFFDWSAGIFDLDDAQQWNIQGIALHWSGRYEESVASFDNALDIQPNDDYLWYNRGIALGQLGRYEEAIASYDKALEYKPDFHEAWNNRGVALRNLGQFEAAIASYDKALEIKPDFHEAWINRGLALANLRQYKDAIASYDKALELKPDDHEAWTNRSIALVNLGRYEEAIASFDKALEYKPDDHGAWINRGLALGNLGRYEEAIASFDKALEYKPDDHEAWYNRACSYALQGNTKLAIENLQKAISLSSENRELAKTDSDFDSIRHAPRFQALINPELPASENSPD